VTPQQASADLILKLYELRREKKLRKARQWFGSQNFQTVDDVVAVARGKDNAYFRMVVSYWDMVSALVIHGGIDAAMFHDAGNEHVYVWAKLEPFIGEFRARVNQPTYAGKLERMIAEMPDGKERVSSMQARQRAALSTRVAEGEPGSLTTGAARNYVRETQAGRSGLLK
jgi:hypothetical protein